MPQLPNGKSYEDLVNEPPVNG